MKDRDCVARDLIEVCPECDLDTPAPADDMNSAYFNRRRSQKRTNDAEAEMGPAFMRTGALKFFFHEMSIFRFFHRLSGVAGLLHHPHRPSRVASSAGKRASLKSCGPTERNGW